MMLLDLKKKKTNDATPPSLTFFPFILSYYLHKKQASRAEMQKRTFSSAQTVRERRKEW